MNIDRLSSNLPLTQWAFVLYESGRSHWLCSPRLQPISKLFSQCLSRLVEMEPDRYRILQGCQSASLAATAAKDMIRRKNGRFQFDDDFAVPECIWRVSGFEGRIDEQPLAVIDKIIEAVVGYTVPVKVKKIQLITAQEMEIEHIALEDVLSYSCRTILQLVSQHHLTHSSVIITDLST